MEPTNDIQPVESVHGPTIEPGQLDMLGNPLDPKLPRNYQERFQLLTQKADFADTVFAHIANGGTLITLAEAWGVRFSDISNYIGYSDKLRDRYHQSLIARSEWETERLLQELRAIATVDIREAYDANGRLKNIKDIPYNVAAAISSVESDEITAGSGDEREVIGETKKVKFWDKAKAIEMFMKKHGLLVDRHRVDVGLRLEDLLSAVNDTAIAAEVVTDAPTTSDTSQPTDAASTEKKQDDEAAPTPQSGVLET